MSARRRAGAWLVVIAAAMVGPEAVANEPPIDAERMFEQAADRVGDGDAAGAARLLRRIATEFPESRQAPEALFLAGELYEDRLDDPRAAIASYRAIVSRYASSRVSLAAERRLRSLEAMISGDPKDADRLARFLGLRRRAAELSASEALAEGERLLADAAGWSSADRVRVWMAGIAFRDGRHGLAEALYRAALDATDTDIAYEARVAASGLARQRGAFDEARRLANGIKTGGVPGRIEAQRETLASIDRSELRKRIQWVAVAIVIAVPLFFVGGLLRTRSVRAIAKALWPPPIETIYMAPIGLILIGASFTGHHGIAEAVAMVVAAGLLISWLSGASLRVGSPPVWRSVLGAVLSCLAVLAAGYIALHYNQLLDLIISTVRFGPDV